MPNSYACRKGRGPLAAVQGAERFIKQESRTGPGRIFALKVDISRFFPSLDHEVLLAQLKKHLENDFFLWLTERIVRHRPTAPGCYRLKSRKELWQRIEPEKSLFKVPNGKGLPIGNLTSQFFANVYMHPLDEFLAKSRKGKFLYWQRYVDDVLIFGTDAKVLSAFAKEIDDFVQAKLKLRLNPKKTFLQSLCHGVDHLGFFIKPSHTTIRRSVMRRAEARMRKPYLSKAPLQSLQASLGHAQHGKNLRWRRRLVNLVRLARCGQNKPLHFLVDVHAKVVTPHVELKSMPHIDDLWNGAF